MEISTFVPGRELVVFKECRYCTNVYKDNSLYISTMLDYMYLSKFLHVFFLNNEIKFTVKETSKGHSYKIPNLRPGVEAKTTPSSCSGQPVVGGGVVLCARRSVRIPVRDCIYLADPFFCD